MLLLSVIVYSVPLSADPAPIVGRWQLDPTASGNAAEELKGIRKSKRKKDPNRAFKRHESTGRSTQRRYWEKVNEGKEWRHTHALVHAGPMQRLLESENLEIVPTADGYVFIYADGYERAVVPNPAGRVFTASGEELVNDDIGYTLAYWDEAELILETRTNGGGKLRERVATSAGGKRLTVKIEIDRRDWKWIVKLDRVFDRAAGTPSD